MQPHDADTVRVLVRMAGGGRGGGGGDKMVMGVNTHGGGGHCMRVSGAPGVVAHIKGMMYGSHATEGGGGGDPAYDSAFCFRSPVRGQPPLGVVAHHNFCNSHWSVAKMRSTIRSTGDGATLAFYSNLPGPPLCVTLSRPGAADDSAAVMHRT